MLAFRFEHDSSEPHPLLTFEVKSKRLLCINCQTEELLVYEATYHAEVMLRYYRRGTSCTLEHLRGKESAEETVNYERRCNDDVKQTTRDDGNQVPIQLTCRSL